MNRNMMLRATMRGFFAVLAIGAFCTSTQAQVYVKKGATGGDGQDWTTPYGELSTALAQIAANAHSGETELYVAEGTYLPGSLTTDAFILPQDYSVYGGFLGQTGETLLARLGSSANTILSGDLDGTPNNSGNCRHVVVVGGRVKRLEGFTITGGYAVVNNQLEGTGAGLLIVGSLANPGKLDMLVDCHFRDNIALKGGGLGGEYAIVNMKFCSFHRNLGKEKGGGVWLEHYGVTPGEDSPLLGIFSTNFTNNIAGTESPGGIGSAIAIENMAANVQIYNCRFADNYMLGTGGAGTIYIGDQGTKSNTGQGHDILVGHCTLAANQSLSGATHPGIYFSDSRAFQNAPKLILNSILYFNGGAAVAIDSNIGGPGGTPNIPLVTSSDIQMPTGAVNAWPGTGNIMVDPGFVDYSVRSLGLDGKSPCLNTGLDGLIVEDLLDLDDDGDTDEPTPFDLKKGYVRIAMPSLPIGAPLPPPISTDMGCHERQGYIPFP